MFVIIGIFARFHSLFHTFGLYQSDESFCGELFFSVSICQKGNVIFVTFQWVITEATVLVVDENLDAFVISR